MNLRIKKGDYPCLILVEQMEEINFKNYLTCQALSVFRYRVDLSIKKCFVLQQHKNVRLDSNIESKSSNYTYLNIIKILFYNEFLISCINNVECKILVVAST